jgi:predicted nucleic acid-binding Zn ribbon protein
MPMRPCLRCGAAFSPVATYQIYCSPRCRSLASDERKRRGDAPLRCPDREHMDCPCPDCGRESGVPCQGLARNMAHPERVDLTRSRRDSS